MVGYQLRFHPCLLALQRALHENSLGHLLSVRAHVGEYLPGWHPYEDYRQMYASRSDLGGGVLVTQIHEFDYLYALFGLPRRVFAIGGHWSHLEIDVEDVASTLMEFQFAGATFARSSAARLRTAPSQSRLRDRWRSGEDCDGLGFSIRHPVRSGGKRGRIRAIRNLRPERVVPR